MKNFAVMLGDVVNQGNPSTILKWFKQKNFTDSEAREIAIFAAQGGNSSISLKTKTKLQKDAKKHGFSDILQYLKTI